MSVQVANGQTMQCQSVLLTAAWHVDQYTFHSDLGVLPLSSYDIIIGMDWQEAHSPMKVHWHEKWLSVPYHGTFVTLQGILSVLPTGAVLQLMFVTEQSSPSFDPNLPPNLLKLLQKFGDVFTPPSGLPPSRTCDHSIPFIDRARPICIRPYRYAPAIKNEIERQVAEMLDKGIIQKSTIPFSSLVLLVKKD